MVDFETEGKIMTLGDFLRDVVQTEGKQIIVVFSDVVEDTVIYGEVVDRMMEKMYDFFSTSKFCTYIVPKKAKESVPKLMHLDFILGREEGCECSSG